MARTEMLADFWEAYGDAGDYVKVNCFGEDTTDTEEVTNLAADVLDYWGIPLDDDSREIGGNLTNLDIKQLDAMQVIKMSLLHYSSLSDGEGYYYEPIVNQDGKVKFKALGKDTATIDDIYHTMQTAKYVDKLAGVMVMGAKPLVKRLDLNWVEIWGTDENGDSLKKVFDTDQMHNSCLKDGFSQYASIVFKDPFLDSAWDDGVDNVYEKANEAKEDDYSDDSPDIGPYDSVVGWATWKDTSLCDITDSTTIKYGSGASIPVLVVGGDESEEDYEGPYIGTLATPLVITEEGVGSNPDCWNDKASATSYEGGIPIPMDDINFLRFDTIRGTTVDKFLRVEKVYVVGKYITLATKKPGNDESALLPSDDENLIHDTFVTLRDTYKTMVDLTEGVHYVIAYEDLDDGTKKPYIVFADRSRQGQPGKWGQGCEFYYEPNTPGYNDDERLVLHKGTILPLTKNSGVLVSQVWAYLQLDVPSIEIYDPRGSTTSESGDTVSVAVDIANNLKYWIAPIIVRDPPPPVAFNGELIDQVSSRTDSDPTTTQDFTLTAVEQAQITMQGGGLNIQAVYLTDKEDVKKLSETLYTTFNSEEGFETVYVCGPDADVELCDLGPAGGTINSISYSYQDQNSYTISIIEGSKFATGFGEVSGGPSFKTSSTEAVEGTIIDDKGNGIFYKVRIDGYGDRLGICCCPEILRVGDKVSGAICNNPIES